MVTREIRMPLMGEMISEGTLLRWLSKVGDVVLEGDPLFDVSTEKVETEVTSPISGRLTELLVAEGDTVPIGTVIALVGEADNESADAEVPHPTPAPLAAPTPKSVSEDVGPITGGAFVPFTPMRKIIGQRLTRSLADAAHTLAIMEVDYEQIERARSRARSDGRSLTYLPFVARAVVDALADFPFVNAHVRTDGLVVFDQVHLGIAVDIEAVGLVVPVVHNAEVLRLEAIADDIRSVSARVRAGELTGEMLDGGTFTITNPGGLGTVCGRPIINSPQAAILEVDGIRQMVVPVPGQPGGTSITVRRRGNLSLSYDHRAFDGVYACSFLRRVVDILSDRTWLTELNQ